MLMWLPLVVFAVFGERATGTATCLPNGIAAEQRKNLSDGHPVGVILAGWSSARVTSAVLEILMSEILGYNVQVDPTTPASSLDAFYGILGCATWSDLRNRRCEDHDRKVTLHVMSESWLHATPAYKQIVATYRSEAPVDGGDMGYIGTSGQYVPKNIKEAVFNASGVPLEYYKSYDARWFKAGTYFDQIASVNTSKFLPCDQVGQLVDNATIFRYLKTSGDLGGVTITNNSYRAFCSDGFFWRSPACREFPQKCVLYVTAGDGWDATQNVKYAVFNMPIAYGTARSYADYLSMPLVYNCLLYWWTPDASFLEIEPSQIVYPPHNKYEWLEKQLYASAGTDVPLSKLISPRLDILAPDIVKLMERSLFDIDSVNLMMRQLTSAPESRIEQACNWLKDATNEPRWRAWIPDSTECSRGSGLYNEMVGFVAEREAASACEVCLPGTFSKQIEDSVGITFICVACPAGQQQPAAAATACEPCPAGTFKAIQSTENCMPCPPGRYEDQKGSVECKECPESTTTVLLGVKQPSDCVCVAGTIDVSNAFADGLPKECAVCLEGLSCPDGGTIELLLGGAENTAKSPEVLSGYFSFEDAPLETYKCSAPFCPGGLPGICPGGRLGPTCAECPRGMYWADNACSACTIPLRVAWILGIVVFVAVLIVAYYTTKPDYVARASLQECVGMGMEMMLNFVQNLGILSAVQVPWPQGLKDLFQLSSIFVLNLQNMGVSCASDGSVQQYLLCTVIILSIPVTLPSLGMLTQISFLRSRRLSWDFHKILCVIGKFLQSGFTAICNVGMAPFMCLRHPNGRHTMLKYPNTFCNNADHSLMQAAGVVLIALAMSHLVICTWACCNVPVWSVSSRRRLVAAGFLISNYKPSTWWFGLVNLVRGPLLSVPAVVATNLPAINLTSMLCILLVSSFVQIYFLPWKAPVLNLVDAISTCLFLILLAISLHLEPTQEDTLPFLDSAGVLFYYLSIGVIASVFIISLALLAWQSFLGRKKTSDLRLVNLGKVPDAEELLAAIDTIATIAKEMKVQKREAVAKKVSVAMSPHDLFILKQAFSILFDDFELGPSNSENSASRIVAKRASQLRLSLIHLGLELEEQEHELGSGEMNNLTVPEEQSNKDTEYDDESMQSYHM